MPKELRPQETSRARAFEFWIKAPYPMVTLFKTLDVTNLVRVSKRRKLKFNMLLDFCIGKAASKVKEFYLLSVGEKLLKYDFLAVNTIVKNINGELNSCDIPYSDVLDEFNECYLRNTSQSADNCQDIDLSSEYMVIGTSAIVETELNGIVNIYTGVFNNPFVSWGRYRKKLFRYELPVSLQFHHTQMDGAHAGKFLENLQKEIYCLK